MFSLSGGRLKFYSPEQPTNHIDIIDSSSNIGIMSASSRIPPIALPFVSEGAKKTLDLVCTYTVSLLPLI